MEWAGIIIRKSNHLQQQPPPTNLASPSPQTTSRSPEAPHSLEDLSDVGSQGIDILQMPKHKEFDQDFLGSQESLCIGRSMTLGERDGSINNSNKDELDKEEQERGGLEQMLWPLEVIEGIQNYRQQYMLSVGGTIGHAMMKCELQVKFTTVIRTKRCFYKAEKKVAQSCTSAKSSTLDRH